MRVMTRRTSWNKCVQAPPTGVGPQSHPAAALGAKGAAVVAAAAVVVAVVVVAVVVVVVRAVRPQVEISTQSGCN
jgi:hypothetical protein